MNTHTHTDLSFKMMLNCEVQAVRSKKGEVQARLKEEELDWGRDDTTT